MASPHPGGSPPGQREVGGGGALFCLVFFDVFRCFHMVLYGFYRFCLVFLVMVFGVYGF